MSFLTSSKFLIALIIALALDAFDYIGVGMIPVFGDFFDIVGVIVLFFLIGPAAFLGLVELVPILGDLLPSFTAAVLFSRTSFFKNFSLKQLSGGEA